MAARALASATIAFGMVSIPVKLFTSGESAGTIRFNQLHQACGSRIKQQYTCPKCDDTVPRDDIVKGYEFAKDQYVTFSPEELKTLEQTATQSIDIKAFVPAEQVDRLYLDRVYYLGPDKGGARAYRLLSHALTRTERAALAQYSARGKQYLVLVRPFEQGLAMEQLRYADEIKSFDEVPIDEAEVKEGELELAIQLIEQVAVDEFEPENYSDEVRARTLELIERKVEGEDITVVSSEESETKIIDMMEALKASLAAAGKDISGKRKPAKRATKKKTAAKKTKAQAAG